MRINLVAAIDANNGIGFNNKLPWHLPADLKHFKSLTQGKIVIMGYKTFESIGKELPNRLNIILSQRLLPEKFSSMTFNSLEDFINENQHLSEVYIIGGGSIFQQSIKHAQRLYITHIEHAFQDIDSYFPEIDIQQWNCTSLKTHEKDKKNLYNMTFCTYERIY